MQVYSSATKTKHKKDIMKNMQKTKPAIKAQLATAVGVAVLASIVGLVVFDRVKADTYDDKIKVLEQAAKQYNNQALALRARADSLAKEIEIINQQKADIQVGIDKITAEINQLNKQLQELEKQIDNSREALGDIIASIYLNSKITLIEKLASSRAITDFIDDEAHNQSLRHNLTKQISEIKTQKAKVSDLKQQQELALKQQQSQMLAQQQLEAEKQRLMNETKGDELYYRKMVEAQNTEIAQLREQQRLANIRYGGSGLVAGDPGRGGYPTYLDAPHPMDSKVDPWGMYNRECVSYVAWKVHQKTGRMPYWGGIGNAWQWAYDGWKDWAGRRYDNYRAGLTWHTANSTRFNIKSGNEPKVGSVAVWRNGQYGHVMWVEAILPNGDVWVSQYNYNFDGQYSEMKIKASSARYLYF